MADTRSEYLVELPQDLWLTFLLTPEDAAAFPNLDTPAEEVTDPEVTALAPNTAVAETGPRTTVQVTGTGFSPISQIVWGGRTVATAFVGETALRFTVDPSSAVPGTVPVAVANGSQASDPVDFTFTEE